MIYLETKRTNEKQPIQFKIMSTSRTRYPWTKGCILLVTLSFVVAYLTLPGFRIITVPLAEGLSPAALEGCAWSTLQNQVSLLDIAPISRAEFIQRQTVLAAALEEAGVDAFIAEPSASSTYFANISSSYNLSERPFLMILDKHGQFSYLAPKFELGRISGLSMVYKDKKVISWAEEVSPYTALKEATGYRKVILDEHVRYMIAAGLESVGIQVAPTPPNIQSIRNIKSKAEHAILRGINFFTVEAVRSLQRCLQIGVSQATVVSAASSLFGRAGVGTGLWVLVLIGDQAANPHGGSFGRSLMDGEYLLIDIGSSLHGYRSDVTRTILPPKAKIRKELMDIWYTVYDAQSASLKLMQDNQTCASIDGAARKVITDAGYGEFFTHRLGHGLGIEVHEHPYLNGANGERLKSGEIATNEPGIYVTTDQARGIGMSFGFGIRLEDPVLVSPKGGIIVTNYRAKSPYEP